MKKQIDKTNNSKEVLIVSSIVLVLAIGGFTWYYLSKKKGHNAPDNDNNSIDINTDIFTTPPFRPIPSSNTSSSSSSKPLFAGFPLKRGSRGSDVKILQRYLKFYKENLGRSGKNRDGVDGIFGPLTERAARKRLGKTSFSKSDINSMKNALKIL